MEYRQGAQRLPTPAELAVLRLAALGLTNVEIAAKLRRSSETVKTEMKLVRRRIGAKNRAHAVHIAHQRGWIE